MPTQRSMAACCVGLLLACTSIAQSHTDTTWSKQGRVESIYDDVAGTWTHFSYYRMGALRSKSTEMGEGEDAVILDTAWNKDGALHMVVYVKGNEWIITRYDARGILDRRTTRGELKGEEFNSVTLYHANGNAREHYFEVVKNKGVVGIARYDSVRTIYYETGKVRSEVGYERGVRHGVATAYYPSGMVESTERYIEGRLMDVHYYDTEGKELSRGAFAEGNGLLAMHEQGVQVRVCRFKDGMVVKRSCKCE